MSVASRSMTVEEFLALPDDGVERDLIRGELREYPLAIRDVAHGFYLANLNCLVSNWNHKQARPRGRVYLGGVAVCLGEGPKSCVGADLVYLSPRQAAATAIEATSIDLAPVLVVEVLSPSDTIERVAEKVREYLAAGVALVWVVEPNFFTVTVYRPDAEPQLFNHGQELSAEPHLPGLRLPVIAIFED